MCVDGRGMCFNINVPERRISGRIPAMQPVTRKALRA